MPSYSVKLKSSSQTTTETVPIEFSDVSDDKVTIGDFYHDARSLIAKANSTKFILVSFLMIITPLLLMYGYISDEIYREIVIVLSITYLGVDVYEKKSLIKKGS